MPSCIASASVASTVGGTPRTRKMPERRRCRSAVSVVSSATALDAASDSQATLGTFPPAISSGNQGLTLSALDFTTLVLDAVLAPTRTS
jgi:hypothetical protein